MRTPGEVLADLRIARNMTQAELAQVLHVAPPTISNYEGNKYRPDIDKLTMLADFFNVTIDFLLARHDVKIDMTQFSKISFEDIISGKKQSMEDIYNTVNSLDNESMSDLIRYLEMLVLRQKASKDAV